MRYEHPAERQEWSAVVIGASTGGIQAISRVLAGLSSDFAVPVVVLMHVAQNASSNLAQLFVDVCRHPLRSAEEKLPIERGTIYVGAPGYHLLVEQDETFSFSLDSPVNYSRPSIDVLFESAADVWRARLIGVLLTGANADGTVGAQRIRERGGYIIVQDPAEAEAERMPRAAIEAEAVHEILPVDEIGPRLVELARLGVPAAPLQSAAGGSR